MILLIDDMREGRSCDIIARTAVAGKAILERFSGEIDCLLIDYDLGGEISGYHIVQWAFNRNILPRRVEIISANPPGRKAIRDVLVRDAAYIPIGSSAYERRTG